MIFKQRKECASLLSSNNKTAPGVVVETEAIAQRTSLRAVNKLILPSAARFLLHVYWLPNERLLRETGSRKRSPSVHTYTHQTVLANLAASCGNGKGFASHDTYVADLGAAASYDIK